MTVMWSFASKVSIDGKVSGPGIFGFQDMVAGTADPQIAKYSPRCSKQQLREAFQNRWVHGFNTRSPWYYVDKIVSEQYAQFRPIPWFIGEYGANSQTKTQIRIDLEAMDRRAQDGGDFLGSTFFQFQTDYQNGGLAKNFGMFGLGSRIIGETGEICDQSNPCAIWPVHCLTTDLTWLPGAQAERASAVASAWGGSVGGTCRGYRRLEEKSTGTKLACQFNASAVSGGAAAAQTRLSSDALEQKILARTTKLLGEKSPALRGELSLVPHDIDSRAKSPDQKHFDKAPDATAKLPDETGDEQNGSPAKRVWKSCVAVAALIATGCVL